MILGQKKDDLLPNFKYEGKYYFWVLRQKISLYAQNKVELGLIRF